MTQYGLPIFDMDTAQWTEGAGDGDGDVFDELDEGFGAGRGSGSGPDGATTYWANTGTKGADFPLATKMNAITDPVTDTGHVYRTHNRKSAAAGRQVDITIRLNQIVPRASQLFTNVDNVWTTRTDTLTTAEANSITSYAGIELATDGAEVGGGAPRDPQESAQEFECPDPAGGGVTVPAALATATALSPIVTILTAWVVSASLATATALSPVSTHINTVSASAATASALSPESVVSGEAVIAGALATATALSWDAAT
ncbi:hypothetical protein LCGC14_1611840, partial [marine sediment metagenome]